MLVKVVALHGVNYRGGVMWKFGVLFSFIWLFGAVLASGAGPTELDWKNAFEKLKAPNILFSNERALENRLRMLDYAPKGSEVLVLAFVFDNGETTRRLAAHICKASLRGVKVRWLTDSKSGSMPGRMNVFDQPVNEEIFQYMSNCGAAVRIYNHYSDFFNVFGVWAAPARKYVFPSQGGATAAALNRINHRKLFWVKTPGGQACFLLGGRNLGDHYLSWHDDSFLDADIMICNHYKADQKHLPYGGYKKF